MITALLILVVLVAIMAVIGGFAMMSDGRCVISWHMGLQAATAGFELIGKAIPELFKVLTD